MKVRAGEAYPEKLGSNKCFKTLSRENYEDMAAHSVYLPKPAR
jgi:hypothetical protein